MLKKGRNLIKKAWKAGCYLCASVKSVCEILVRGPYEVYRCGGVKMACESLAWTLHEIIVAWCNANIDRTIKEHDLLCRPEYLDGIDRKEG